MILSWMVLMLCWSKSWTRASSPNLGEDTWSRVSDGHLRVQGRHFSSMVVTWKGTSLTSLKRTRIIKEISSINPLRTLIIWIMRLASLIAGVKAYCPLGEIILPNTHFKRLFWFWDSMLPKLSYFLPCPTILHGRFPITLGGSLFGPHWPKEAACFLHHSLSVSLSSLMPFRHTSGAGVPHLMSPLMQ